MTNARGPRRHLILLLSAVSLLGCGRSDEIRTYAVPKEQPPAPFASKAQTAPVETGEPVDRMLTVIVPEAGRAWFYKAVGPISAVDEHEKAILDFVASIPPAGGAASPNWTLPAGWTARPGTDGVTLATIQIPVTGKPLEISVSALPWSGTQDDLLRNVNRWRGQMGLPQPVEAAELAKDTRELKAGERTLTVVDLKGTFRRGMMPPFAGGAAPRGNSPSGARGALPADHPPMSNRPMPPAAGGDAGAKVEAAAPAALPKFAAPSTWQEGPAGGMNRAVYRVSNGAQEGAVTVSNIPATSGEMFADPLQTANLWRRGVGMPPATPEEFAATSEKLEIGGRKATFVTVIPPADKPEATVAAMLTDGDQIWYFKFKGARQLVLERQDEFKAFLKSVRFGE